MHGVMEVADEKRSHAMKARMKKEKASTRPTHGGPTSGIRWNPMRSPPAP